MMITSWQWGKTKTVPILSSVVSIKSWMLPEQGNKASVTHWVTPSVRNVSRNSLSTPATGLGTDSREEKVDWNPPLLKPHFQTKCHSGTGSSQCFPNQNLKEVCKQPLKKGWGLQDWQLHSFGLAPLASHALCFIECKCKHHVLHRNPQHRFL